MLKSFIFIIVFITHAVLAQEPTLEAYVNKTTVTENEIFTYTIASNQDCPITPPNLSGFEIVSGPIQGRSSSTVSDNRGTVTQTTYSFTYNLRLSKKGNYSIGPAKMKCKLKKETTSGKPISIKVIQSSDESQRQESKAEHFLKLTSDKNSVYVGEPFVITLKFYTPKKPNSIEALEPGNASGLWRQDLNPNRANYIMTQEVIKGAAYYVLELKQEVCIPLRAGKISIEPYYGSLIYQLDFFNSERLDGRSNGLDIDVKKIPSNSPANFNGLVGRFNLRHEIDKTKLIEGQAIVFKIELSGTGNFNAFDQPLLNLPSEFTQGDPTPDDQTTIDANGMSGTISYTFIISAEKPGEFEIEPYSFSYFDLRDKSFHSLSTGKINITVEKGEESHGSVYNSQEDFVVTETDIHFIHEKNGRTFSYYNFLFGTWPYFILVFGPILLVFAFAFTRRKIANKTDEEKIESHQKASVKASNKGLDKASQLMKNGSDKEALKLLHNSLITYFTSRLNISISELSQKTIVVELEKKRISTELILAFKEIWTKIEMAQYAPISSGNLTETIDKSKKLIKQLNEKL